MFAMRLACLQGHVAATSPTFQHSLPSVFPEPAKFVPDRFVKDPNVKVPPTVIARITASSCIQKMLNVQMGVLHSVKAAHKYAL